MYAKKKNKFEKSEVNKNLLRKSPRLLISSKYKSFPIALFVFYAVLDFYFASIRHNEKALSKSFPFKTSLKINQATSSFKDFLSARFSGWITKHIVRVYFSTQTELHQMNIIKIWENRLHAVGALWCYYEGEEFSARVMKYEGFGYFSHPIHIEQIYLHTATPEYKLK